MTNLINEVCEEEPTAAQKNALPPLRRRDFVRLSALGAAAYAGVKAPPLFAADKDKVVMGFIYVGPRDDYGYNQAHFEGKTALAKLDWVKAVDEER
ncbi:MAG TPA: hypothetical protein PKE57_13695, partial [Cellvibrionaceae bacterium]|nr:hypothetical protein [Cellvibrionaceae bacterium]